MSHYVCPYCSLRYQINIKAKNGIPICGQCGDPLIKKSILDPKRGLSLILVAGFIIPLISFILSYITNQIEQSPKNETSSIATTINQ